MATGTVRGKGKPKGFRLIPEGEQILHITEVAGKPRAGIKLVEMKMTNVDGISLTGSRKQVYDLESDGGYAAFYYLVLNGLGIDLDDGDEFDISELEDAYIVADIVHKHVPRREGDGEMTFSNIAKVIGPAPGFEDVEDDEDESDEDYD